LYSCLMERMTEKELDSKYSSIQDRVSVSNHDCTSNLVDIGKTQSGIPIVVNKDIYKADIKIAVGNILPHCYARWGGGAKTIQLGVCG